MRGDSRIGQSLSYDFYEWHAAEVACHFFCALFGIVLTYAAKKKRRKENEKDN